MYRFLFFARPEAHHPETQQKVFLIALYALTTLATLVVPINAVFGLSAQTAYSVEVQFAFLGLLTAGVVTFWVTRRLALARTLARAALFVLAAFLVSDGGGTMGIGYLYFVATFPLLYLILGLRWGLAFVVLFLAGLILPLATGTLPADSLLATPGLQPRLVIVFLVAAALAALALVYQNNLVKSLAQLAYVDPVTGMASRNRITENLGQAVHGPRPFALVALKLHHFGLVSNHLGLAPGDWALGETARRIQHCLPADAFGGRWTGTLFVFLIPDTNLERLEDLGRTMLHAVAQPVALEGEHLILQPGLAITRYPEEGTSTDRLMANLSTTLARGEDQPGQVLMYDEVAWKAEERRFQVAAALEEAVARGHLSLAYQPKVRLADRRPHGAEILLRWNHPTMGPVSPGEFIPVAETLGIVHPITWLVVDRFLADLSGARDRLEAGPFALNLSSQDLGHRDLASKLVRKFAEARIPPSSAELEITEGVMMSQDPHVKAVLDELKTAGFRLAIDDFGTGYSSLSYLHKVEADTLKIDQSFVRQLGGSAALSTIVDAIVSMGQALGMTIVAEGVETEAQADYLAARGCTLAQGWLFGKPMPFDQYLAWLDRQNSAP